MGKKRKTYTGKFKTTVALEAIKGELTTNQIAKKYDVHPQMVTQWKKKAIEGLPELLSQRSSNNADTNQEELTNQLYQQIGQLKVELDWLKKKSQLL